MADDQKLEYKINSSPTLTMSEITKKLFNRNFHSDVRFIVEGKIIFAHSLELIKRSVVFEQQLDRANSDNILITIDDCKYASCFEFVRYMYTDECEINDDNFIDILKLAVKYQCIKLENRVLSSGSGSTEWRVKCFEYCIRNKYEIARNFMEDALAEKFDLLLRNKQFLSLHPDALGELLKFERVPKAVTEHQIFTALAEWITSYCITHKIALSEGRKRWDKLIKNIRFPIMPNENIRECFTQYPGLLNENDRKSIGVETVFGVSDSKCKTKLWMDKSRAEFIWPTQWRTIQQVAETKTILSVSKRTILHGLRIGIGQNRKPIKIEILETNNQTSASQKLIFVQNSPKTWNHLIINLGESIQLRPNFKYTIDIKYLETVGYLKAFCRKQNVILNDPGKTVNLIEASAIMVEMFFKPTSN